ncbi:heat shock 70 kDa protein 12A-like [Saccoglossus kowalevskii]
MSDFEIKKRSPDFVSGDEMTRIRLPYSFPTDDKYVGRNPTKNNIMISKGCLCLGPDIMKSLFFPPLKKINDYLNRLLKERSLQDVKSIFLVGGFSENALLQNQIKRNFGSRYRILTPIDAGLSVMKGAVLFGLNRDSIKTRISPYTYGSDLSPIFNPKKHEEKYKFTLCGVERINVFNTLVTINENVKIGEVRTFIAYPTHDDQTSVHFGFYTTTQKQVKYVDEPHVKKVGCVTLPIPDITKGRNRKLELKVEFGRTEIKATTRDVKSGNVRTIYLDFMND